MSFSSRFSLPLVVAALALGCAGSSSGDDAALRVVHLSPGAPDVDVFLDGDTRPAVDALRFGRSTPYLDLPAGNYRVDISAAGGSPDTSVLRLDDITLDASDYTAVAYGTSDVRALLLEEPGNVPAGSTSVRIVHLAEELGPVTVAPIDSADTPLAEDLAYGTSSRVITLPPSAPQVGVDADGDGEADLVFQLPALEANRHQNVFAVEDEGGIALAVQSGFGDLTFVRPGTIVNERESAVRVLHLSPDAPNVDVFVNDGAEPAFANVPFSQGTTAATLDAGTYDFAVSATGASAADAVLRADGVALEGGASYTVVAIDQLDSISALLLEDDFSPTAASSIRVRAIHAAAGVGTVDLYAQEDDGTFSPLIDALDFGTAADAIEIPAGAQTIGLDADLDGLVDLAFELPSLVAGTIANLYATADADGNVFALAQLRDGNTLRIDASEPQIPTGNIRVLHLSPDAPNVDVFVNGSDDPAITNLAFGDGTTSIALPAGNYRFDVSATGAPRSEAVITVEDFSLERDRNYTVIAFDSLAEIKPLVVEDDFSDVAGDNIRVRAIHVAANVREVDVYQVPDGGLRTILAQDVAFGVASDNLSLPAAAYNVGLDIDNDSVIDASYALPSLPAGTIANVYAVSDLLNVFLIAQFADGSTARID